MSTLVELQPRLEQRRSEEIMALETEVSDLFLDAPNLPQLEGALGRLREYAPGDPYVTLGDLYCACRRAVFDKDEPEMFPAYRKLLGRMLAAVRQNSRMDAAHIAYLRCLWLAAKDLGGGEVQSLLMFSVYYAPQDESAFSLMLDIARTHRELQPLYERIRVEGVRGVPRRVRGASAPPGGDCVAVSVSG